MLENARAVLQINTIIKQPIYANLAQEGEIITQLTNLVNAQSPNSGMEAYALNATFQNISTLLRKNA